MQLNWQILKRIFHFHKKKTDKIQTTDQEKEVNDQSHVMTAEEKLDEALKETFPASDPPGHYSQSIEDHNLYG